MSSHAQTDPATLAIFNALFASVAEEMGVALGRTAHSPNIKERHDYSCAVFDDWGRLVAQAAHIPVHLGAMPEAVRAALPLAPFAPGDIVILNDPYLGGTHLPDVTMVSPVFAVAEGRGGRRRLVGFVASRAHHADVGGGAGAGPQGHGLSGIHTHMTNTQNTPVEALEMTYPFRIRRYDLRRGSGGAGRHRGGDGLVREWEFLAPAAVTIVAERRRRAPWGLAGGAAGRPGRTVYRRAGGEPVDLPSKAHLRLENGDILTLESPGGGGWGAPTPDSGPSGV
jgi:N-methylhydantoinase B/oxoprolinase/acetone carboxylase alpha subunit